MAVHVRNPRGGVTTTNPKTAAKVKSPTARATSDTPDIDATVTGGVGAVVIPTGRPGPPGPPGAPSTIPGPQGPEGKIAAFVQDDEPVDAEAWDLWIDTDEDVAIPVVYVHELPDPQDPEPDVYEPEPQDKSFAFSVPSTTWVLQHDLGRRIVDVLTVDANGEEIIGDVMYQSTSVAIVEWYYPTVGTATVSL